MKPYTSYQFRSSVHYVRQPRQLPNWIAPVAIFLMLGCALGLVILLENL